MPDGTRTDVYLAQFLSAGYAQRFKPEMEAMWPKGVSQEYADNSPRSSVLPSAIAVDGFGADKASGGRSWRFAYVVAGDTLAVVVQSRGGRAAEVPFRQTVRLQAQLLG